MFERVKNVLINFVQTDSSLITPDAYLMSDLGLNSLEVVNVVDALENEFCIEIADRDIRTLETVGDVITYIEARI